MPNLIVTQTILVTGTYDFSELFRSVNMNLYTRFLGVDLGVSALVFIVFYFVEANKKPIKFVWLPLLGTLLVGLSFGFPLMLLLRELSEGNNTEIK